MGMKLITTMVFSKEYKYIMTSNFSQNQLQKSFHNMGQLIKTVSLDTVPANLSDFLKVM